MKTCKYQLPNLFKLDQNLIVITLFRQVWYQTEFHFVLDQTEKAKYNHISIDLTIIKSRLLCVGYSGRFISKQKIAMQSCSVQFYAYHLHFENSKIFHFKNKNNGGEKVSTDTKLNSVCCQIGRKDVITVMFHSILCRPSSFLKFKNVSTVQFHTKFRKVPQKIPEEEFLHFLKNNI